MHTVIIYSFGTQCSCPRDVGRGTLVVCGCGSLIFSCVHNERVLCLPPPGTPQELALWMASTETLGSSALHTDCSNRGRLHLDRFRQPPIPSIAVPVITAEAAAACAETAQAICARDTPVVVRGSTDVFRTTRWSSSSALVEHYGDVPFELAADVTLSIRDYVRYAASAAADYPYYLVERRFEGERAALLQDYAAPTLFDDDLLSQVPRLSTTCMPSPAAAHS